MTTQIVKLLTSSAMAFAYTAFSKPTPTTSGEGEAGENISCSNYKCVNSMVGSHKHAGTRGVRLTE